MYGLIWRVLPGPWFVRFTLCLGLVAGAAALLWYVAFPEIAPHMPFRDSAVEVEEPQSGGGGGAGSEEDPAGEEAEEESGGSGSNGGTGQTGNEAPPDEEGIVGVDVPVGGDDGS